MEVKNFHYYNATAEIEFNPNDMLKNIFRMTEVILEYLQELKPEIQTEYLSAFKDRLTIAKQGKSLSTILFDLEKARADLTLLNNYLGLQKLIAEFLVKHLNSPKSSPSDSEKVIGLNLPNTRAYERLSYHRAKAFVDVLGKGDGMKLFKEILTKIADRIVQKRDYPKKTQRETCEGYMNSWCKTGLGDFTACFYDDYKVLFRFDKCVIHEAVKDFDDPDIAYLSSCYLGAAIGAHSGKFSRMRRTQTLHHGDFCDELYWDEDVYPDCEQPSLEFIRNLGKEEPPKTIEKYQDKR